MLHVFDTVSGSLITTMRPDNVLGAIWSLEFSPDGKTLLTGSLDKTAAIWSATNGILIKSFEGHTDYVRRARFSPDGSIVLTVSNDQTARLWDVKRVLR